MTYTGTFYSASDPYSILVPLVVVLFTIENIVFGVFVGQARKKYGIPYPTMYAVPGSKRYYSEEMKEETKLGETITDGEAYSFNLVQRGHQNTLENAPFFLALLLVAWPYPFFAGIAGFIYLVGRAVYMYGYSQNVKSRLYGAFFIYPPLLVLLGLAGFTMWNVVHGIEPY